MKLRCYTVYDSKVEAYLPPFFIKSDGQAQRDFTDAIALPDSPMGRHPEDYTLFFVGLYDDSSALLEPIPPISLGNGVEYVAQPK